CAVVHGVEYAFGAHDHATTGIFEVEPKQCPGFVFRKSILIGRTDLGPKEVRAFMEKLAEEYSGNTYHLITKNCNHFCNDVCTRLTGKPIPRWVNRLARLGKDFIISYQFFAIPPLLVVRPQNKTTARCQCHNQLYHCYPLPSHHHRFNPSLD
ncbi:deSI-like protein At4g17486, partial [Prunus avium]|uniref:DeSI-like protein At4g17486 n=1 Tax=Prunus avium TaxID=42229 RepID=A0A6P5RF29_PRUAV